MTTLKSTIVNGRTFELTETFEAMDQQVMFSLGDAMLSQLGGTLCMNQEVEFILRMEHEVSDYSLLPFTYDDITNNDCTGEIETQSGWETMTEEQRDTFVEELEEVINDWVEGDDLEGLEEVKRLLDDANDIDIEDHPEIMQWFTMDDRLLNRLEGMGQCTLDNKYWGRQAYGQSITMDQCIMRACYDLAMCWAR